MGVLRVEGFACYTNQDADLTESARQERMHPSLTTVQRIDELERLIAESDNRPLLLFKHSRSCGISAEALDELIEHLNSAGAASHHRPRYAVVTVQTHRDVSNAVAARLGVR